MTDNGRSSISLLFDLNSRFLTLSTSGLCLCCEPRKHSSEGLMQRSDHTPWCRGDGLQLRAHGSHSLRSPGKMGRFASRLATTVYVYPDQERRTDLGTRVAGRTAHRSVVPPGCRAFGRPRKERALNTVPRSTNCRAEVENESKSDNQTSPSDCCRSIILVDSDWPGQAALQYKD